MRKYFFNVFFCNSEAKASELEKIEIREKVLIGTMFIMMSTYSTQSYFTRREGFLYRGYILFDVCECIFPE